VSPHCVCVDVENFFLALLEALLDLLGDVLL
jgi:hypothetical protein